MMEIDIIDSGSHANGYLIQSNDEAIAIECGCPIEDCLKVLNYDISRIKCVLISHEHKDHSRYVKQYKDMMLPIVASRGTLCAMQIQGIEIQNELQVDGWCITAFPTSHDAEQPTGFLIDCPSKERVLFATDTSTIKEKYTKVDVYMVECNHDTRKLIQNVKDGVINKTLAKRIIQSHLSTQNCMTYLDSCDMRRVQQIILLHRSADNQYPTKEVERKFIEKYKHHVKFAKKNLIIKTI